MPLMEFEKDFPANERPQTIALHRSATKHVYISHIISDAINTRHECNTELT
jgi:hypothetical protein